MALFRTRRLFLHLLLLSAFGFGSGLSFQGCHGSGRRILTWADLATYRSLPVTIEGTLQGSYMTNDSCFYSEWAYGVMRPDGVSDLTAANQSNDSITVVTPTGIMRLDIFEIRTYIGSYYSRTFNPENVSAAPTPVQKVLEKTPETISVQEYLLQPNKTYYVRVRADSAFSAPTGPEGKSNVLVRNVLEISDLPFREEKPPRPPTPAYGGKGI